MVHRKILMLPGKKTLTLLMGIPASGKTYLANKMKTIDSQRRVVISSDKIRRNVLNSKEMKVYFDQSKETEVWGIVERKVYETLKDPKIIECILDAVNMTYFSRYKFIQMAKELNIHTRGIVIYRSWDTIKKWNMTRKYPVSESILMQFFRNFKPPIPEEFDELLEIGSFKRFKKERKHFKSH